MHKYSALFCFQASARAISFKGAPLCVSTTPCPFVSGNRSYGNNFSTLFRNELQPFFLCLFFPSFLLPSESDSVSASRAPFTKSSSSDVFRSTTCVIIGQCVILTTSAPGDQCAFSPSILPTRLPRQRQSYINKQANLSYFQIHYKLFHLSFFTATFCLGSPCHFSLRD